MFEKASRLQLRFATDRGPLSAEDLWLLPLTSARGNANLDDIARGLHAKLKSGEDVSFVVKERKSDEATQLAFDIVKHVIDVRLNEAQASLLEKKRAEKKQKIMEILASKQDESLHGMSVEGLQKLMADL